jgi:ubiquinone/menaquinone biosynthesis C-methylase UbiE
VDPEQLKYIARQLRKPFGEHGIEIGEKLVLSNATLYQHALNELDAQASDHILEIGMGTGSHVNKILNIDPNIRYVGCDYSQLMVDEAVRVNASFIDEKRAQFICADVTSLPLEGVTFNKAFTVNTIYFWEAPDEGIRELRRLLKVGGQLIIAGRPKHVMENYPFTPYGFNMFDKFDVSDLLEQHGFDSIKIIEEKEEAREMDGQLFPIETLIVSGWKVG